MEINKILNADILDIIFDGKNKLYGAYDLRRTYDTRLKKALLLTASLALLVFLSSVFAEMVGKKKAAVVEVLDTQMAEVKNDEPPPPPPPPPPKAPPPPEINQIKFTPPKIVKDEEVKPDEKIEEIKEEQVISTKTVESENTNQVVQAPIDAPPAEGPKSDDEDKIFTKVEKEADFPGGTSAWARYLERNLNAQVPVDNGAPEGNHTVVVKFIVSKDGTISDVTCLRDPGFGMCEEAVKIIKKGPKWTPALQNGRNVNAYRQQPITFAVSGE